MRFSTAALAVLLVACGGDKTEDSGAVPTSSASTTTPTGGGGGTTSTGTETGGATGTATGGATGTEVTGEVTGASCSGTANALRFDCVATAEGELSWTVYEGAEAVRTFASSGPEHAVTLYGLAASTDYTWEASGAAGSAGGDLTTGALPSGLADLELEVSGSVSSFEHVLFPIACEAGWIVVADSTGRVVWYEEVTTSIGGGPSDGVSGFSLTDRASVVTAARGIQLVEWPFAGGTPPLDIAIADQHHDVHYSDGYVYVLTDEVVDGLTVDGFTVFDSGGSQVGSWQLADHVEITGGGRGGPGGAAEWSHGNALVVEDGLGLMSLRWQNAVVAIAADPTAADFGEIQWILIGDDADLEGDFTWTDGGGYVGQHHATWTADGKLSLFDNGDRADDSRVLHLDLDPAAGTVSVASSFDLGTHCDIQGAGWDLADGGVLATCGDGGWAAAYDASGAEQWRLELSCSSGGGGGGPGGPGGGRGSMVPRVRPLTDF